MVDTDTDPDTNGVRLHVTQEGWRDKPVGWISEEKEYQLNNNVPSMALAFRCFSCR